MASQVFNSGKAHVPFKPSLLKQINLLFIVTVLQFGLIGACVNFDFYLLVYFVESGDIAQGAFWKGYLSTAYAIVGLATIPVIVRAAKLIAPGNAKPDSAESFQQSSRHTFRGKLMAVVQSTGDAGEVRITVTGQGLKSAHLVFTAE